MKEEDKTLEQLTDATHAPRGRYSREESWKLLQARMAEAEANTGAAQPQPTIRRLTRRWRTVAAAASIALLFAAGSYAAYRYATAERAETRDPRTRIDIPQVEPDVIRFEQTTLADIARRLSDVYGTDIRVEGHELQTYRMTATFTTDERLDTILTLLCRNQAFGYERRGTQIVITDNTH
jgi:hypothetical protein